MNDSKSSVHKFDVGGMWEESSFTIETNHRCSVWGDGIQCEHCSEEHVETHKRNDGSTFEEIYWICESVVIATNEGGCNSTGVCLQCIINAAKTLEENK